MLVNNRIVWKDNATLKDLSLEMNNIYSGTKVVDIVAAQDKLYIGSDLPFNHRYFEVSAVNAAASVVSAKVWDGSTWNSVVNLLDETSVSGATFAQSGIISWTPDRDSGWSLEDKTADISELSTITIYDMYWVELSFSGNLTGTTALKYVGHKFCRDEELYGFYPDLADSNRKTAYASGKSSWHEQTVQASEIIVRDLRKKGIIWSSSQIVDWAHFTDACVHKAAAIIYGAFGDNNVDDAARAEALYKEAMNKQVFNVDRDKDARLDRPERVIETGLFRR